MDSFVRTGRRDWMWGVALGVVAAAVALGAFMTLTGGSDDDAVIEDTVAGIPCASREVLTYHVHSFLAVYVDGEPVPVPANTGVRETCLFWLHTHDDSGLVHIEAPEKRDFTLGQFFAIWGQPLSATQLASATVDSEHEIKAWVNGEEYAGDPASIPLEDKTTIVVGYGPPFVPPPEFKWGG